jgi:DNA-binding CsgD family transcriptional regulator
MMGDVLVRPDMALVQGRLNSCETPGELLSRAAQEACDFCGFTRGLVLGVEYGMLVATGIDALTDPASDALRRIVLSDPIVLEPSAPESELVRGQRADCSHGVLGERLGLEEVAVAVVAPEGRAIALLVLDRTEPEVDESDQAAVTLFAHLLGCALERVVLRRRMSELATELRHLTVSAHALMTEALEAPVALPTDFGHGSIFTTAGEFGGLSNALDTLLSDRERDIAALMIKGYSNRQIGDALHLSPDTVKVYVSRLVRKLGATNRVDAVARYVSMRKES